MGGGAFFVRAGLSGALGAYNDEIDGRIFSIGVNFGAMGNIAEVGADYNIGGKEYLGIGGTTITNLFYDD